ncbi:hypothetical protein U1Q18_030520 [Sarracenia purpurea var. burkii]
MYNNVNRKRVQGANNPSQELSSSLDPIDKVACTIGILNALEFSQAQGCQEAANSIRCGELPINIAKHSSVGIADDSLDKDKSDFFHLNGMTNSNGLSKADLHQYEGIQKVVFWVACLVILSFWGSVFSIGFAGFSCDVLSICSGFAFGVLISLWADFDFGLSWFVRMLWLQWVYEVAFALVLLMAYLAAVGVFLVCHLFRAAAGLPAGLPFCVGIRVWLVKLAKIFMPCCFALVELLISNCFR